jgi:NADPH-dependent curcumin reductase CurA
MRGAIAGRHMGHARLNQGDVIYGRALAEVMESRHPGYAPGEIIALESGWQQYCVSDGGAHHQVRKIAKSPTPLSAHLGVLGMPGLTAWAGVEKLASPALGSTFVVSAAAGPVGGTAGQLAKAKGCRAVGIAGSDEKCRIVTQEYGFDACVNYKQPDWPQRLKETCPAGVDVYFDNVGGPMLDAVTAQLNLYGKIVLCGLVSQYNRAADGAVAGHNLGPFVGKRAQLFGLVVYDYYDRLAEFHKAALPLLAAGRLAFHEDRAVGLENAPAHFVRLMNGENTGKALVVVGPEPA